MLPGLVESGFATAKKVAQDQRPDKSVYRLTRAGRAALKAWLEETPPPDPARNLLLTKVFFGDIVSPDVLAGHIRQRRLEAEQLRAVLEEIEARADPDDLHRALTRGWGLEYTRAFIRWAKQAERELCGGRSEPMKILLLSVSTAALVAASPAGAAIEKQRPLKLRETCVTRAERAHVVRFRASDGVRLIGVELGRGPRVVILAHSGASDLCSWLPYGRTLASRGYRVLAFDQRGFGSSGHAGRSKAEPGRLRRARRNSHDAGARRYERDSGRRLPRGCGGPLRGSPSDSSRERSDQLLEPVAVPPGRRARPPRRHSVYLRCSSLPKRTRRFLEDAQTMYEACSSADKQIMIFPGVHHGAPLLREPNARAAGRRFHRAAQP